MSSDAVKIISSDNVPWTAWAEVPRFGLRYRHLTQAAIGNDYHVGVAIEELPAGKQSVPAHYHFFEEEHVYILEGSLTVRIGADRFPLEAGDYVCFPAGQRAGHCLINDGDAACRYVIIGERIPNDVVVYPDSNKVLVRSLGRRTIFDRASTLGYWHGENTGLPADQAPPVEEIAPDPVASPKAPISSDSVEWQHEGPEGSTRFGGRSRHLTYAVAGRDYHVGVLIESPAPGMRLAPLHYHMLEEEHALILEGEVTLLFGAERLPMKPGDYVCFPAGVKVGHSFLNSGDGPCSLLMIGEHNPNEVCVYPDSNKVMVRALRSRTDVFDMAAARNYWDGEDMWSPVTGS